MRIFYCTLFILLSHVIHCQCNIKTSSDANINTYSASYEILYEDDDFSQGIFAVLGGLEVIQRKTDLDAVQMYIHLITTIRGRKPNIVPRKMIIVFTDDSSLDLTASDMIDPINNNGIMSYICIYKLHQDDYLSIRTKSIKSIKVLDNRSNNNIVFSPYANVFKEQAGCIAQKFKKF